MGWYENVIPLRVYLGSLYRRSKLGFTEINRLGSELHAEAELHADAEGTGEDASSSDSRGEPGIELLRTIFIERRPRAGEDAAPNQEAEEPSSYGGYQGARAPHTILAEETNQPRDPALLGTAPSCREANRQPSRAPTAGCEVSTFALLT